MSKRFYVVEYTTPLYISASLRSKLVLLISKVILFFQSKKHLEFPNHLVTQLSQWLPHHQLPLVEKAQ